MLSTYKKLALPVGYPTNPVRQIPEGAVALEEKLANNGNWLDLLALMEDGTRVYVTTKPVV